MERTKRPALLLVARVLDEAAVPYAVIGGVALQLHSVDPRTTLDVDLAVLSVDQIPRASLEASGFVFQGRHAHSENWVGPEDTPVQFTDDAALSDAIRRAETVTLDGVSLRILRKADLLREKLRSGSDPARRRSKRLQDLVDAQRLIEDDLSLRDQLSDAERAVLDRLPQ